VDPLLAGIELSEWRLVGPGLAALIVALALRFRLSRARIQEFLRTWLGVDLSIGTLHQTIHESSAVVAPAEDELVQAVLGTCRAGRAGPHTKSRGIRAHSPAITR
jgi:hypothetical protein